MTFARRHTHVWEYNADKTKRTCRTCGVRQVRYFFGGKYRWKPKRF